MQPLSGKPCSRSGRLGKRPSWGWKRDPLPAGKWSLSKFPANPAPLRGAGQPACVPGGASAGLPIGMCWCPEGPPRRWEGRSGAAGSDPWWETRQAARRRSPVAARALVPWGPEGQSRPPSDPARDRPGSAPGGARGTRGWPAPPPPWGSPAPAHRRFPPGRGAGPGRPAAPQLFPRRLRT